MLEELIENSGAVEKYKNSAQEYILTKYNWEDVCDRTLALYQK